MHPSFVPYLIDPVWKEPLSLHADRMDGARVVEGRLVSPRGLVYPITRGVPRFVDAARAAGYAASFAEQWRRWGRVQFDSENVGRPMQGHTRRMWEVVTGVMGDATGAVVGDFGCGPGRFLETVRAKGGRAIGLELSDAVEVAGEAFRDDPDVLVCQADVLEPPFAPASLDGAFSIGVLHHTPAPARGVAQMAAAVRPGGWVAVCVYPRGGYYDARRVRAARRLVAALAPAFGLRPLTAYARFTARLWDRVRRRGWLGAVVRRALPFVGLPDPRWSELDTFDSLSPVYQSTHTSEEVRGWLEQCGLVALGPSEWGPSAYRGRTRAGGVA